MIERGDEVLHRPTGENWVVKRAGEDSDGGFIEPAGWTPCRARASDCELVAKGSRPVSDFEGLSDGYLEREHDRLRDIAIEAGNNAAKIKAELMRRALKQEEPEG